MPAAFKDYYQTLGVPRDASDADIKKAFRTLARKYHPDVAKDKHTAEDKFKDLNEAHEVLSHPENRRKYDAMVAGWRAGDGAGRDPEAAPTPRGSPGRGTGSAAGPAGFDFHFEGTGFSDFFEQFFGSRADASARRSGGRGERPVPMRQGHDIEGDILITLDEVLAGAMRNIAVRSIDPHTGQESTATHAVRIPPGVHAGQSIRIPGKGGEGTGGGGAGDIYLRVRYAEHPEWSVDGANLLGELRLAPWEAVLGATVPVHTLEGTVSVKVPAGTQQGHRLRVRGKGLPMGSAERGDLYVEIAIQVPARVCREDEVLWRQLAAQSAFDPRKV